MSTQQEISTNAVVVSPVSDPLDPQYWTVVCRNVGGVKVWMSEDQDGEGKLTGKSQKEAKQLLANYRVKYAATRMATAEKVAETGETVNAENVTSTQDGTSESATSTQDGTSGNATEGASIEVLAESATSTQDGTSGNASTSTQDGGTNDAPSLLETIQATISTSTSTQDASKPARSNAANVPTPAEVQNAKNERAALRAKGFDGAYGSSGVISAENQRVRDLNNLVRNGTRKPSTGTTTTRTSTASTSTSTASKGKHAGGKHEDTALYAMRMIEREIRVLALDASTNASTISVLDQYRAVLGDRVAGNDGSTRPLVTVATAVAGKNFVVRDGRDRPIMQCEIVGPEVITLDQYGDIDDLQVQAYWYPLIQTFDRPNVQPKQEIVAIKVSQEVAEIVAELTPDVLAQFRAFQAMLAASKNAVA